jgi:hypothetical protein
MEGASDASGSIQDSLAKGYNYSEVAMIDFKIRSFSLRPFFLALWISCVAVMVNGCDSASETAAPAFLKAFSDFEFVGSGPADTPNIPSHDLVGKALPLRFETGVLYIFHHRRLGDGESLFDILQAQLKKNGVTILEAKIGPLRFIGGPAFQISFEEGGAKGTVFTSLDFQVMYSSPLYEQWDPDDYIIRFESVGAKNN